MGAQAVSNRHFPMRHHCQERDECPAVPFDIVQALILKVEPPTVEQSREMDLTVVNNSEIDEIAGQQLDEFKGAVMGRDYVPYQGKTGAGGRDCSMLDMFQAFKGA